MFEWTIPTAIATTDAAFDGNQVAIAVDSEHSAHVVVGSRSGIIYVRQRDASWRTDMITTPHRNGYDGSPAITVGDDGRVAVVYQRWARWECQMAGCAANDSLGVALIQRGIPDPYDLDPVGEHEWGEPEPIGGPSAREPDIDEVEGLIHLAYVDDESLWFESQGFDFTESVGIAPSDSGWPSLAPLPASACVPAVLFTRHEAGSSRLMVALTDQDEHFVLVEGPSFNAYRVPSAIGLAGCDPAVAVGNGLWSVEQEGWSQIRTVFPSSSGLRVGDMGGVPGEGFELVSSVAEPSQSLPGLWFAAGYFDGPMSLEEITSDPAECCLDSHVQALALDDYGHPHVVWTTGTDELTVWYATGRRI